MASRAEQKPGRCKIFKNNNNNCKDQSFTKVEGMQEQGPIYTLMKGIIEQFLNMPV